MKQRNQFAKSLASPHFRKQIIQDRKKAQSKKACRKSIK